MVGDGPPVVGEGPPVVGDGELVGPLVGPLVGALVGAFVNELHLSPKPPASCLTLRTSPLVGIVNSQSAGFLLTTSDSSVRQASDAHILTYCSSVGSAVANNRL